MGGPGAQDSSRTGSARHQGTGGTCSSITAPPQGPTEGASFSKALHPRLGQDEWTQDGVRGPERLGRCRLRETQPRSRAQGLVSSPREWSPRCRAEWCLAIPAPRVPMCPGKGLGTCGGEEAASITTRLPIPGRTPACGRQRSSAAAPQSRCSWPGAGPHRGSGSGRARKPAG